MSTTGAFVPVNWQRVRVPQRQKNAVLWTFTIGKWFQTEDLVETSSLVLVIKRLIAQLRYLDVQIPRPESVFQYLLQHPEAVESTKTLITFALTKLSNASFSLEVYEDPEIDDSHLVIYARFREYNEETPKMIRAVREEYLSKISSAKEWPLLTTDFRTPNGF